MRAMLRRRAHSNREPRPRDCPAGAATHKAAPTCGETAPAASATHSRAATLLIRDERPLPGQGQPKAALPCKAALSRQAALPWDAALPCGRTDTVREFVTIVIPDISSRTPPDELFDAGAGRGPTGQPPSRPLYPTLYPKSRPRLPGQRRAARKHTRAPVLSASHRHKDHGKRQPAGRTAPVTQQTTCPAREGLTGGERP